MRDTCFVFGVVASVCAGVLSLPNILLTLVRLFMEGRPGMHEPFREVHWGSDLVHSLALLGGMCFIAAAIIRHGEQTRFRQTMAEDTEHGGRRAY